MNSARFSAILLFCGPLSLTLAACGESAVTELPSEIERQDALAGLEEVRLQMAGNLSRIARDLAIALGQDASLRDRVRRELDGSQMREGKLEFRRVLHDDRLQVADAVAGVRGTTREAIYTAVDSVVDLELYFPVPSHRSWSGDRNLVIATALEDDDPETLFAYDLDGRDYPVSPDAPPPIPTLVVVPAEQSFGETARDSRLALSTLSGSDAPLMNSGTGTLTMTRSYQPDDHEPWFVGDPEIYVHVATRDNGSTDDYSWTRCSGDAMGSGYSAYQFDQNSALWTGSVRIAGEDDLLDKETRIQIWEDDNDRCDGTYFLEPYADTEDWADYFTDANTILSLVLSGFCIAGKGDPELCIGLVDLTYNTLNFALHSINDDLIGTLAMEDCFSSLSDPQRYRQKDESDNLTSAYVEIDNDFSERELCPPDASISGDTYACTDGRYPIGELQDATTPSDGGLSYEWIEDNVLRGTSDEYTIFDTSEGTRTIRLDVTRAWDGLTDTEIKYIQVIDDEELCLV